MDGMPEEKVQMLEHELEVDGREQTMPVKATEYYSALSQNVLSRECIELNELVFIYFGHPNVRLNPGFRPTVGEGESLPQRSRPSSKPSSITHS